MFRLGCCGRARVVAAVAAGTFAAVTPGVAAGSSSFSFTVDTTADAHDATAGNGVCAESSGQCTLRAAIEEANALPAGTIVTVTVPAGTYNLKLGPLAVTHNTITLIGAGNVGTTKTTVHQGGGAAVASVAAGANLTLSSLVLTNGGGSTKGGGLYNSGTTTLSKVTVTANTATSGAGITNASGANLHVGLSIVSNNTVSQPADSLPGGSGGGILNAGTLTLVNSNVTGNYAGEGGFGGSDTGGTGGNGGGIDNTGTVTVTGGKITGNYAGTGGPGENEIPGGGGSGGGIYSSAGTLTLTSATVSGNFAGYAGADLTGDGPANAGNGGGIFNSAKTVISKSTISSNHGGSASGRGSQGGGLYNSGTATVSTTTFNGDVAGTGGASGSGYGGGIANVGTLTLTNSTLSSNAAAAGASNSPGGDGGGLYQGAHTATLKGDTFNANASGNGGAGVYCDGCFSYGGPGGVGGGIYSTATLNVTNSTLSGNTVGVGGANAPPLGGWGAPGIGGGVATGGGATTLLYTTVAGNSDGIFNRSGTIALGGTIVADSTGANDQTANNCTGKIAETTGFNLDSGTSCQLGLATDISGQEPLLGGLAANGGSTMTQALQSGSPAIDHGGTAATGCSSTDQRGKPRPDETADNGSCDIGAYESQGLA